MTEVTLYCDGRLNKRIEHIAAQLRALPQNTAWKVTWKRHESKRTTDQNALLWALYEDIIERGGETMAGWDKEDLHEFFLGERWGWTTLAFAGQRRKKPARRSSRLNKTEFSEFVEFILRFMAEQGVYLTLPSEEAA